MKGLEGMPIRLLVVCLLLAVILGVGMWQMNFFMDFKAEKDFKEGVVNLAQTAKTLKSTGDFGAFTTVQMKMMPGFGVMIDLDSDVVTGILHYENYTVNMTGLGVNMTAARLDFTGPQRNESISLTGGRTYNLMLYYGRLNNDEVKEYTLVFE